MAPASHLPRACCASSLRGIGSRPGGDRAVCDLPPVPAAPGLCCNPPAAPLAFPSPLPRSSPDAAPHPLFPRAAPLLPSSARRCAAGPALPHPRDGGSGIPRPCLYREFCGLMACLHPARESKPSRGGRSINRANIYARANPRGAGMRPAAGAGRTPLCRGKAGLAVCSSSIPTLCHHPRLPGGGQPSGSSAGRKLKRAPAGRQWTGSWG